MLACVQLLLSDSFRNWIKAYAGFRARICCVTMPNAGKCDGVSGLAVALALASLAPLPVLALAEDALPKVWMSATYRTPYEASMRACAAQGVTCIQVPTCPQTNDCAVLLRHLRAYKLKGFTCVPDVSRDSRIAAKGDVPLERAVFTGGAYRGRAIDRTLFAFEPRAYDIVLEPPVYSAVQCYSERVKGPDGKWTVRKRGHYYGGVSYEPTGCAEVIVPERLFDGKAHLRIIPCEVLPVAAGTPVEGDTVTPDMSGPEIAERRLVRLRFDLTDCAGCRLDKVGLAVYWRNSLTGPAWRKGNGHLSVYSAITRARARKRGAWRMNQWKLANGGEFPEEIIAVRYGDECFSVTGMLNDPACSFPLWGFSESGRADFAAAAPGLVQPRVWGFPEVYGPEAYGVALYRYHLACAQTVRGFSEGVKSVAPHVRVFRNTTRGGAWSEANDHDGTGQELLARELDFIHLDPYPVGRRGYNAETIPFDMGYLSGLARRLGKPLLPWLQAHAYAPSGLTDVTPGEMDRMWSQHRPFAPDAVMWLGFDLAPGGGDTEMSFPNRAPDSWAHARALHAEIAATLPLPRPVARLAVLRPYSVRALCCAQGAAWTAWRNPADRILGEYVRAWSVDHGQAYDVFELPPQETAAERAARERELAKYPFVVSTLPHPRARVLGAGAEGTVLHAADLRKLRAQFKDEIGELLKKGK